MYVTNLFSCNGLLEREIEPWNCLTFQANLLKVELYNNLSNVDLLK